MPWQERSIMDQRQAFVSTARQEGANIAALCRQYGISRPTGYRWLARTAAGDGAGADRSRRPHTSPRRTDAALEERILELRRQHPAWGGRKLHQRLVDLRVPDVPAPSTITAILRRQGLLSPVPPRRDFLRCERLEANALWQMDFMGHRALAVGRVHPLTLVDDHSRFALLVAACANEQQTTVQERLVTCFRQHGLPEAILTDTGAPWGTAGRGGLSALEAWLLRLGIAVTHGRPRHPQTQGKVERFHGTIAAEVFAPRPTPFPDLAAAQDAFDAFRAVSNHERPHEALADAVPGVHYASSPRPFPEALPAFPYRPGDVVCTVTEHGSIPWRRRRVFVSRGLVGQSVAVRPIDDGLWEVRFCHRQVATIDLRDPLEVYRMSPHTCNGSLRSAQLQGMSGRFPNGCNPSALRQEEAPATAQAVIGASCCRRAVFGGPSCPAVTRFAPANPLGSPERSNLGGVALERNCRSASHYAAEPEWADVRLSCP